MKLFLPTAFVNETAHHKYALSPILVMLLLGVSAFSVADTLLPTDLPITGDAVPGLEALEQELLEMRTTWGFPGIAVGIDLPGNISYRRGFGYADVATKDPVVPNAVFRIASVSKPFTACAIHLLAEQGKLDLDQPILQIVPTLFPSFDSMEDPRCQKITTRHLLMHAGGWDRQCHDDTALRTTFFRTARKLKLEESPATTDELLQVRLRTKLDLQPGTRYAYSNLGYVLLGRIIEEVTKQPYAQFIQENVLSPCGIQSMHIAGTHRNQRQDDEVIYHDYPDAHAVQSLWPNEAPVPFPYGGIHMHVLAPALGWTATTDDLLRFANALFGPAPTPLPLSDDYRTLFIQRPPAPIDIGEDIWYAPGGWRIRQTDSGRIIWHMGTMPGTTALLLIRPDGIRCAALINTRPKDFRTFNPKILDLFTRFSPPDVPQE